VDVGWLAVRTRLSWRAGNSRQGLRSLGLEATVNCLRRSRGETAGAEPDA